MMLWGGWLMNSPINMLSSVPSEEMGVGVAAPVGPPDRCGDFGFSSGEMGPPCRTFNERVATHSSILA